MQEWEGPQRIRPRRTKGGIRAQSQRGSFARSWWGERWIDVLEGLDIGMRAGRGRSYARHGQVRSIEVGRGRVEAIVQGSRTEPYRVTIRVETLAPEAWGSVAEALAGKAVFAARLLAGQMPEGIEGVFTDAGLSLFPRHREDLTTTCTCPDEANPCKHIAAVFYLLAEEFDRDPFLIFRLRGLPREDLSRLVMPGVAGVSGSSSTGEGAREGKKVGAARASLTSGEAARVALDAEPLQADPRSYWGEIGTESPDAGDAVRIPPVPAPLPKRLGNFPFWRGEKAFLPTCERIYEAASPIGMGLYLGVPDIEGEEGERRSTSLDREPGRG